MKIVIVLDRELPVGLLANAAAVLAFSAAPHLPEGIGPALADADGSPHAGITNLPIPILASSAAQLAELRARALAQPGVGCIDFPDLAQRAKCYADYAADLGAAREGGLSYLGLCLFGPAPAVRSLTGPLALIR